MLPLQMLNQTLPQEADHGKRVLGHVDCDSLVRL
jgi:hypothetical protein